MSGTPDPQTAAEAPPPGPQLSDAEIRNIAKDGLAMLWANGGQIFRLLSKYDMTGPWAPDGCPDLSPDGILNAMKSWRRFAAHALISFNAAGHPTTNCLFPEDVLQAHRCCSPGPEPWQSIARLPPDAIRFRRILEVCRDQGSDAAIIGRRGFSLADTAEAAADDGCMRQLIELFESTGLYMWPGIAAVLRVRTITDEAQGETQLASADGK